VLLSFFYSRTPVQNNVLNRNVKQELMKERRFLAKQNYVFQYCYFNVDMTR
jgi:hypothetical protein